MSEPTEFEIHKLAKQMETDYWERFGPDAVCPDFIESAKSMLRIDHKLEGLTSEELNIAINAVQEFRGAK